MCNTIQTCDDPDGEVDVDDAGGEGGQDHPQRGEEAAHHHHRTAAEAVHQDAAQRTWVKRKASVEQSGLVLHERVIRQVNKADLDIFKVI